MCNRLAQMGFTGVVVFGVVPFAAIGPVLFAINSAYNTGNIEGRLLYRCLVGTFVWLQYSWATGGIGCKGSSIHAPE